ncbi:MAG: LexA family transcriptional regulator [Crocinitomicaceae bacterium]|jgi:transcriptional regulator with XRE-family HTH domain|nr:LexA family transcriptional regulator [Crocinitomicaceae bacterium]MBT6028934.1 LexA family transcriptional regulator [Crocinitomicaceae bacterium]MBT6515466.1 LexA family transcriptional regulator [Crocinitomicaceae bacterium]
MSKIAKNIAHLRKLRKFTQEQFADEIGIKKSRLGAYEESRSSPPIEMLIKLADYFKLPIDVLVRRDLTLSQEIPFIEVGVQRVLFPIVVDESNQDLIEVVGVKASAGYTEGYGDPEFIDELPKMKLPFMPPGKFRAFPIKGDSMLPLREGAFVVGRFVDGPQQIVDGNTYILVTITDGIVYKRVYKDGQNLRLYSDNSFYTPYEISVKEIVEVWEFTCSINTKEFEQETIENKAILQAIKELKQDVQTLRSRKS